LRFFLNTFPQRDETGELNYVIEGGVAIKLLHPERSSPGDIDIIDLKGGLSSQIGPNTRWFNASTPTEWFASHNLVYSKAGLDFLLQDLAEADFEGQRVTILNSRILAVTKVLQYKDRARRDKDVADLAILGFDQSDIESLALQLKNN
jgi:hypothetical protein